MKITKYTNTLECSFLDFVVFSHEIAEDALKFEMLECEHYVLECNLLIRTPSLIIEAYQVEIIPGELVFIGDSGQLTYELFHSPSYKTYTACLVDLEVYNLAKIG